MIITGTGRAFSAGYDIGAIPDEIFERDAEALVAHPFHAAMEAVSAHPYPVVAAINGHCLGGGLELAVRCDLRICAAGAKLGMPPAKLGLIYGHTGLERFIDVVGVAAHARALPHRPQPRPPSARSGSGSSTRSSPTTSSRTPSLELAAEIAANAPLSMTGNKRAIETLARFAAAHRGAGAGADRAAPLVLRLRGLPRGHPRLRREAQARRGRAADRASGSSARSPARGRGPRSRRSRRASATSSESLASRARTRRSRSPGPRGSRARTGRAPVS